MDSALVSSIEPELSRGERILWVGKPSASREARKIGCPALIVGIPFTAFAVFWVVGASNITRNAPSGLGPPGFSTVFPLFGLIFVGIGLYVLLSPFLTYAKSSATTYAITNERILIVESGSTRVVKSYTKRDLGQITRSELADGSGDLMFAQENQRGAKGRTYTRDIGFVGIGQVRAVEQLLRDTFDPDHS
jgi:hypothetical protein